LSSTRSPSLWCRVSRPRPADGLLGQPLNTAEPPNSPIERHTALSWPEPQAMTLDQIGARSARALVVGLTPLVHLRHLLKLPARRGEAGPEPCHPRRAVSTPSHSQHRRLASGRAICCPCTNEISRRRQSEIYPRTWASFIKQCHSPLALRQYSLSASPAGVVSIGSEYTKTITKRLIRPYGLKDGAASWETPAMPTPLPWPPKRYLRSFAALPRPSAVWFRCASGQCRCR
jgi:hypothetical protein